MFCKYLSTKGKYEYDIHPWLGIFNIQDGMRILSSEAQNLVISFIA
jgi:hypothetical protein